MSKIKKLAKIRREKGLTQIALSIESGVPRVSISRYENGRVSPNVRILERLANALGVSIDELIDRKAG